MTATPDSTAARSSFGEALAVYLKPRVLIVLFLGFSAGLPLALSGSTLRLWMRQSGVDLETIGLFALVGTPYTIKFLWAPVVDALDAPLFSRLLGRRRGWLVMSQILMIAAIVLLGFCDPARIPWYTVFGAALLVATASATQDIVIDAFRIESLPESEQAAGMASYVAAYRIGVLVSTAGALFIVSGFRELEFGLGAAWMLGYLAMAALVVIGIATALVATEPEKSAAAASRSRRTCAGQSAQARDRDHGRRLRRFPHPRHGDPGAVLCRAVQVHRCLRRRHDRGLRPRSRLFAHRICRDHQGRRARRDAARRLRRRLRRARLSDGDEPVDRRHPAGGRQPHVLRAGDGRLQHARC